MNIKWQSMLALGLHLYPFTASKKQRPHLLGSDGFFVQIMLLQLIFWPYNCLLTFLVLPLSTTYTKIVLFKIVLQVMFFSIPKAQSKVPFINYVVPVRGGGAVVGSKIN